MSQSLSYVEAWRQWAAGDDIEDKAMMGITILWWGRIGKIVAFVGGGTFVLDLIGPQRLREWGRNREKVTERVAGTLVAVAFASLLILDSDSSLFPSYNSLIWFIRIPLTIATLVAVFYVLRLVAKIGEWIAIKLCDALDHPTPALSIRVIAGGLLLIGFHFDLLAS